MASLAISEIKNENLRKAAEMADSNGKTAFNQKLDANEIGVFVQEAKKMGCTYNDIIQITNSVGLTPKNKKSITKMEQLENIEILETKLEIMKSCLNGEKDNQANMTPQTTAQNVLAFGGLLAGFKASKFIADKLGAAVAAASIPKTVVLTAVAISSIIGVMYLGIRGGLEAGKLFDSEYTRKQRTKANNHDEKFVKPLQACVSQTEEQLEAAKTKFYDEQ